MVGHGGSSAGSYLADPTSPIPSHCASIVMTSTIRVKIQNTLTITLSLKWWNTLWYFLLWRCAFQPIVGCSFQETNRHLKALPLPEKPTIHQVTTLRATSKNVLFPDLNHLLTCSCWWPDTLISPEHQREVASMVVTWWIAAFLPSVFLHCGHWPTYI